MKTLAATLFSALLAATGPVLADTAPAIPKVSVTGEGTASLKPDMAVVTMAVVREAATARAALDENNAATAAVIAAMKETGIEERDLQTSAFSISPQYTRPGKNEQDQPARIAGYRVSNTLTARIRDLAKLGTVIDRSVNLGVNEGGNIVFTNDDPSAALGNARTLAVKDAIAKARTLTDAAGVGLGKILEISEQSFPPGPIPMAAMRTMAEASTPVPLESGENTYRVEVNMTFQLDQ